LASFGSEKKNSQQLAVWQLGERQFGMKSEAALALAKAIEDGLGTFDIGSGNAPADAARIMERLTANGVSPEAARAYADAFTEYSAMTEAIRRDGPKPAHTRRLDRARAELARLRWVKADWLWNGGA
jgi:hypothetical protein